jgi:hypothetical protein
MMTGCHSKEMNCGKHPDFYVGGSQEKIVNPEDGDEDLMNRIDELPNDKIMSAKSCVLVLLEMACSSFNES